MESILLSVGLAVTAPPPAPLVQGHPAPVEKVYSSAGLPVADARFKRFLALHDIVFVGEKHDELEHHKVQAEVLNTLHAQRPDLRVGLEMISFDKQPILDDFISGKMSEADFKLFWRKEWGYDYALYEPVLGYCLRNKIPLIALNAPRAVIVQIARGGLSSLTPAQRALLPASVKESADARYRDYTRNSVREHDPNMPPEREKRMLEAMAAWNETMGERAANAAKDRPLLVIAGLGHLLYNAGIPESAARRGAPAGPVVLPFPLDGPAASPAQALKELLDPAAKNLELADYFRLLPD